MQQPLTIVTYHYVRDLKHSRYPAIKGLSTEEFAGQVEYINRHYDVIGAPALAAAVAERAPLPPRPLLLTFDDGYLDHFKEVLPILEKSRLPGCFFPPARCVVEHRVLDVNKIHFVLASIADIRSLVDDLFRKIDENRERHDLRPAAAYWEAVGKPNRFDPAEIVFCKLMLQRELPLEFRNAVVDELFRRHVTADEASFAQELYMSQDQLRALQSSGMYVGSHGYDHFWLNSLSRQQQEQEIDRSLEFLASVGADTRRWIMCYPYGAYDASLLSVLRSRSCVAGLTTQPGIAQIGEHDPLTLPRLDTNDLPKSAGAAPGEWTLKAAPASSR